MERSVDGQEYNGWKSHVLNLKVQHIMWLDDFCVNHKNQQRPANSNNYGSFVLPDIEIETTTNTSVGSSGSVPARIHCLITVSYMKTKYSCKYSQKMYSTCSRHLWFIHTSWNRDRDHYRYPYENFWIPPCPHTPVHLITWKLSTSVHTVVNTPRKWTGLVQGLFIRVDTRSCKGKGWRAKPMVVQSIFIVLFSMRSGTIVKVFTHMKT